MFRNIAPFVLAVVLAVLLPDAAAAVMLGYGMYGDVHAQVRGDTLVVDFDVVFVGGRCDSVSIVAHDSDSALSLRKPDGSPPVIDVTFVPGTPGAPGRWADPVDGREHLVGEVHAPLHGRPEPSVATIVRWWRGDPDKASRPINPRAITFGVQLPLSFGYYGIRRGEAPRQTGTLVSVGAEAAVWLGRDRFFVDSSLRANLLNNSADNLAYFFETVNVGWRHHFGPATKDWRPALEIVGNRVSASQRYDGAKITDSGYGGRFGAMVVGPQLDVGYSYGTAIGGYHRAWVDVWGESGNLAHMGTRYEFVDGAGFRGFKVAACFTGLGPGDDLWRPDRRSWPLKVLACGGMLFLGPMAMIMLGPNP